MEERKRVVRRIEFPLFMLLLLRWFWRGKPLAVILEVTHDDGVAVESCVSVCLPAPGMWLRRAAATPLPRILQRVA